MRRLAVLVLALAGCEVTEPGGSPSPNTDVASSDAEGRDGEPDAHPTPDSDVTEEPDIHVEGPPASLEDPLTGLDEDALFPDIAGDDLVWIQSKVTPPTRADRVAPDCLVCPSCGGCTWEVRHRRLPDGAETLIAQETYLQSSPRVGDGHVAWVHSDGTIGLWTIADGNLRTLTSDSGWVNATPIPFQGALWWYGYSPASGQSGLLSQDLTTGVTDLAFVASMYENWSTPNGNLSGMARWQPFSIAADGVVFTDWGNQSQRVRRWTLGAADAVTVAEDPLRDYTSAVTLGDGRMVTKSYERALGCSEQACHPEIRVHEAASDREVAGDGKVTIYGRPVVAGNRAFWLDYRDGPYAIWSRSLGSPDAVAVRMTSDEAILGATAPPSATANRLIWMDRRDGVWRIYGKSL